jgi:thiamine-phosphate pyrophosphorylase
MNRAVSRILDANFNRSREGLRVAEEVVRFALDKKALAADLKRARHAVTAVYKRIGPAELAAGRDSRNDVGRGPSALERPRLDLAELFWANLERAKEALRVLEETSKLAAPETSGALKKIRFELYGIEKRAYPSVETLRDRRPRRGR